MQIAGKEIAPNYGGNYIYIFFFFNEIMQAVTCVRDQLFVNYQKP